MKRCRITLAGFVIMVLLGGCGNNAPLSDVALSNSTLDLAQSTGAVTLSYRINDQATVSIWLEDAAGTRYTLRNAVSREPSSDAYQLTFNGSVAIDADTQRVLSAGQYSVIVQAIANGQPTEQRSALTIINAPTTSFDVLNLKAMPNPFSPNEDAEDDVTNFTYQLPVTATVSIEIIERTRGIRYPFITRAERGPGEQRETWSGRPVVGGILPVGTYEYILSAADGRGNQVTKRGEITLSSSGVGQLRLIDSAIGPARIERGGIITATFTVQNIGSVGIRTHGPPSGFTYTSRQTYASIEAGRYANRGGGLWRVGLDWEGNGGSGSRYPFRWALSPRPPAEWQKPFEFDVLQPGETATIVGQVQVLEIEDRMTFYVGVAHEGVDYPYDRYDQTLIKVN